MRTVTLDGKAYPMREVLKRYKEQKLAERKARQLALFEMKDDARPKSQRKADGRYLEPTLFDMADANRPAHWDLPLPPNVQAQLDENVRKQDEFEAAETATG